MNDLVKLAIDAHNGSVEKYSVREAQETLREALIEANGGSTKIDYRAIRDGKCPGVFTLVEEILRNTDEEGYENNALFNALVEYRNINDGDAPVFDIYDDTLLFIDTVARGTQAVRRQRLGGVKQVTIPVNVHAVRVYEDLDRILARRADFNDLIDNISRAKEQKLMEEIYTLWDNATSTDMGTAYAIPNVGSATGSYSESTLLTLIEHVEAAAGGKTATIIGTKAGIKPLMDGITAPPEVAKEAMYNDGYIGKFYGANVIAVPQRHKVGTTNFAISDKTLTIVATSEKPIKVLAEGNPLIIPVNPENNMDLTQEYFLADKWGAAVVMNGNSGIGKYTIS